MLVTDAIRELCTPNELVEGIWTINPATLVGKGIKLLLCDITNTILTIDEEVPTLIVMSWFRDILAAGIKVALVTNSLKIQKFERLAQHLSVDVYCGVAMPLPWTMRSIIVDRYRTTPQKTALLGDQLLDMACGRWLGTYTFLIKACDTHSSAKIGFLRHASTALIEHFINPPVIKEPVAFLPKNKKVEEHKKTVMKTRVVI